MIKKSISDSKIQGVGNIVDAVNQHRINLYYEKIDSVKIAEMIKIKEVNNNLLDALAQVERVRRFVGEPDKILGSMQTKHGEIAEEVDVAFQNAWDIMHNLSPSATFDGVGRTAPEDYLVLGVSVQSKYINGASNSLNHVIEHLQKYESIGFGRDDSYYVIPRDQYQTIENIRNGVNTEFSEKTIRAINIKVSEIEKLTGKVFEKVVRSGNVDYADVQLGKIHSTLKAEELSLHNEAIDQVKNVSEKAKKKIEEARQLSQSTNTEALRTAEMGAALSGGIQFALEVYDKRRKNGCWEFTANDWKEILQHSGIAATDGGVFGYTIYKLTNEYGIASAQAAGLVSTSFGICKLANEFRKGHISEADFLEGAQLVCINSACSTLGATLGQTIIPVPVLGALIGSTVSNYLCKIGERYLSDKENKLILQTKSEFYRFEGRLNKEFVIFWNEQTKQLSKNLMVLQCICDDRMDDYSRYLKILEFAKYNGISESKLLRPQSNEAKIYFCD